MDNATDIVTALANEFLSRGATKREVMEHIVRVCREIGLPEDMVRELGWDMYKRLSEAAA